jgi:hypothetical protein
MTYSLDGNANISVSGVSQNYGPYGLKNFQASIVLPVLSEGSHRIDVYAGAYGGPTHKDTAYFSVDLSPPQITILSPENRTYGANPIPLNFSVSEKVSCMEYRLDGVAHTVVFNIISVSGLSLKGLADGVHSIVMYATDLVGHQGSSEIIRFTVDTTQPHISILSPENTTYHSPDTSLTFSVSKPFSKASYSLDGNTNVTAAENTTLSSLTYGLHSIAVYANDTLGNTGASETVFFTISPSAKTEESFPIPVTTAFTVSVAVVCIGLLAYFKKHKK